MLLIFRASGRKNYAIEALNFLAQFYYLFPPRLSQQLLWSRFVNTQGRPGCNIPCDLHLEHMNRLCKDAIGNLGPNKTEKAIVRAGKSLGTISKVLQRFDETNAIHSSTDAHHPRSVKKDLEELLKELCKSQVFSYIPGRKHRSYTHDKKSILQSINMKTMHQWMDKKLKKLLQTSYLNR